MMHSATPCDTILAFLIGKMCITPSNGMYTSLILSKTYEISLFSDCSRSVMDCPRYLEQDIQHMFDDMMSQIAFHKNDH